MKTKLITIVAMIIAAALTAVYYNSNSNKELAIAVTTDTVTIDKNIAMDPPAFVIRPDNTYVDLTTGRKVKVPVDSISRDIVDEATNQPVMFYIDPFTNDTFDRKGRKVNKALIKRNDSSWTVDESKLQVN